MKYLSKKVSLLATIVCGAIFIVCFNACGTVVDNNPPTGTGLAPQNVMILLKHSPVGTTELAWDPSSHKLDVKISLTGLAPKSSHAVHIHAGSCEAEGAIVYPLKPVVVNAKGVGSSETVVENVQDGIPATGWYINIHNGLAMSAIEHMPISCGNIANSDTSKSKMQSVSVTMQGAIAPNEFANGQAELSSANGKLTMKILLTGLVPHSTHIAHIHDGTCESQGPVLAMLKPVVADDQGNGTSVTTFDHLPAPKVGFYVNVHMGATMADLAQPTLFNPIACGNATSTY